MEDSARFYSYLLPRVRKLLSNHTEEIKVRKIKTIYGLLGPYSREQVNAMLENLSEEDKTLVAARYGNDLDNPVPRKLTSKEYNRFYCILVPKMRRILKKEVF